MNNKNNINFYKIMWGGTHLHPPETKKSWVQADRINSSNFRAHSDSIIKHYCPVIASLSDTAEEYRKLTPHLILANFLNS